MKYLTLFFILFHGTLLSQNIANENILVDEHPEEQQLYNIEEQLQYKQKININNASETDLLSTGLLNKNQINDIITHRNTYGKFVSVYELQCIHSIPLDTLQLLSLQLYIPLLNTISSKALIQESTHYHLIRWGRKLHPSKGYNYNKYGTKPYEGDDYSLLYRFRSSFSNLYYAGLSLEKDAGEPFAWKAKQGNYFFDYTSAYLIVHPRKTIDQIAIGDFNFRSGHGLVFGGNFFQSKNPEYWQSTWQIGNGFRPHTSSSEYGFYRGVGLKTHYKHWNIGTFYSHTPLDGTFQDSKSISGINTSGLHRTQNEQNKKHNTHLNEIGANVTFKNYKQNLSLGIEYLYSRFQHEIKPAMNYYSTNSFRGKEHHIIGVDFQYHYHGGVLFTEYAITSEIGKAIYAGILHNLSKRHTWIMQAWSANATFQSLKGNIPSHSNTIGNETGMYQALSLSLSKKTTFSTGISVYKNTQARYLIKGSSYGNEWISRISYTLEKKTVFFLQFRKINQDAENSNYIIPEQKFYIMGDLVHKKHKNWHFHSRVQLGYFKLAQKEKSYCISQSISYQHLCYNIKGQISIFESPSWDSRLYTYEPDVPLAFSIPALSGNGIRTCFISTIKCLRFIEFSFKISHILYLNSSNIGSGNDEIEGNEQIELKVQARIFLSK